MTKINRLSIHGFKSFANKTDILFDDKFSTILGPNGSGKSNVGDAICFVLGRLSAKSMRAEKAANLIFNGGKKKKPADKGTVEIAFCNKNKKFPHQDQEIVLSRTITKSGSSIYRINGKKHTRTETLDLLSAARINPDGHNIILQGDITRLVDMSPVERRRVIEGVSDISLYEEKKHKALLELDKVEEKLNNAEIILKERKTHLRELKKDRDQALKFKDFKEKIDSNKATYLNIQIKHKTKIKNQYDTQNTTFQNKINQLAGKIDQIKIVVQKNKEKIKNLNQEIENKGEQGQIKVHKNIEELKIALTKSKTRISTLKDELTKIAQRKAQFHEELKEHDQKTIQLTQQKQQLQTQLTDKTNQQNLIEGKIANFKKKNNLESTQNLEKSIEEKDQVIEQKQEEIQTIRKQQQDLYREKDRVEYHLQTLDEKIIKVQEIEKENKGQVSQLKNNKKQFKHSTLKLNNCLEQEGNFASQLANLRKGVDSLQEKKARLDAQNISQKEHLFHNIAVKKILENKKIKGIYGTVAQLGKVDKKYSTALETVAGSRTNFIVVENDRVAAECIKYLKKNRFGAASFIPLNKIKSHSISTEHKKLTKRAGVHDFAIKLINFDKKYHKAFAYVFGDALILDNIDTAKKIGIGKLRMATLEGDIAESSGVMRGGFKRKRNAASFSESGADDELKKIKRQLEEHHSLITTLQTRRETNEQEVSSLRHQRSELEVEIIKMEKTLHLDTSDLDVSQEQKQELSQNLVAVNQQLAQMQKNIVSINTELAELKTSRQLIKTEISQLKDPQLLAQLSAFEESKTQFREELAALKNEIKNIDLRTTDLMAPEKNKILAILKQHQKEETDFNQEISGLKNTVNLQEKNLKVKEEESVEFYSKYKELFNHREKLSNEISQKEEEVEKIRDRNRSSEIEINKVSLKNAEVKAKLAALEEEFKQFKDTPLLKNKPEEELKKEINRFEVMLSQMSVVNMKALEIYERVESEYQRLIEKKQGLHSEKGDVMLMMNEIETKKKDQFMIAFNNLNQNFQRIFATLFRKGTAHMELENPDNPFEEGMKIKVKLTGSRFLDIKSLSGGEKTLTALSFIFAIQEYQPASFYILDEIDAALDKHNSETLAKLVGEYSAHAQYIMISHNDSVIAEASTLYGVSMDGMGISKITSLKI
ncbi:chromosome segregation protein SMC [Candidatus Woesearchaeota archaeon]|nr:chromosome segregation protein SMC [Candidatus Woesearchaeota archaeon]